MPSASPVALILGAGANIGQHVSRAFAAKGYKIALAARSVKEEDSTSDQLYIRGDFSDPASVVKIFSDVKSRLGSPSVVIYNAAATVFADAKNPLALPVEDFTRNFNVNTTSALVAAQQAALAFSELPDDAARTFIYTGNRTNIIPIVSMMDSGMGKSATAHMIQCAAEAYKDKGFKFYYADERTEDGEPVYRNIDGAASAKFYVDLAGGTSQGPWQQTFVKGLGYKKF
ncbi:NAD(P)-binding protein [Thozetella sp. PMI_491]|nr:NAD(P)-binding protein [Thozetella sp. PMI_491]